MKNPPMVKRRRATLPADLSFCSLSLSIPLDINGHHVVTSHAYDWVTACSSHLQISITHPYLKNGSSKQKIHCETWNSSLSDCIIRYIAISIAITLTQVLNNTALSMKYRSYIIQQKLKKSRWRSFESEDITSDHIKAYRDNEAYIFIIVFN